MRKLIELAKNDHIQASTVSGICIIVLAIAFQKFLHLEVTHIESGLPGLVFAGYEAARAKAKKRIISRPLLWNTGMLLVTAIIILRHVV